MADRYDALAVRESNGKSYFTKIGAMFPNRDGKGFSLVLDAVPASNEGQYRILMREPLPKDDGQKQPAQQSGGGGAFDDDLDDSVPF